VAFLAARARSRAREFRHNNQFQQFLDRIFYATFQLAIPVLCAIMIIEIKRGYKPMKKTITVNELLRQLTTMKELGFGEAKVIYMDELSITYNLEEGVHDNYGKDFVVLG
jgi:hypothetical protein